MFSDIVVFKEEQQKFFNRIRELNEANVPDKDVRARELNVQFRDSIRKYLPSCLNVINSNYHCHFSIYKIGKDYDSNFKVIETNIKKTRQDLEHEFAGYEDANDLSHLTEKEREQLELAKEIIITYVDDPTEKNNNIDLIQNVKPVATSIITNVPKMDQHVIEAETLKPSEIQYNPYANQPLDFNEKEMGEVQENNLDIFADMVSKQDNNLNPLFNATNSEETVTNELPSIFSASINNEPAEPTRIGTYIDQNILDKTAPAESYKIATRLSSNPTAAESSNRFVTYVEDNPKSVPNHTMTSEESAMFGISQNSNYVNPLIPSHQNGDDR